MKLNTSLITLTISLMLFQAQIAYGQFGKLLDKAKAAAEKVIDKADDVISGDPIKMFEKKQPISTTFDDAIYEADILGNFEPRDDQYQPLDLQPRSENGGYKLKSGIYTMNAKSFCLRGYTYGPSKGDGHLYAPLKGKKAEFVQTIIERYGQKPEIPQQNVQVLLWAIIAGADMNTLGVQHSKTLNELFSTQELLTFKGKDWLGGVAEKEVNEFKNMLQRKASPQLQNLLDADNSIKTMVRENKTFQEIEKVAVIAGVAPKDMVREVSKGRWSYHPDGYFVRFFPNGYPQTRVDVYVPFQGAVQTDTKGKAIAIDNNANQPQEVNYNPSGMVASPANRPSQRIGISPNPVSPCGNPDNTISVKLKAYWKEEANKYLSKNTSGDIKNQAITCAYANMYLKNPAKFKWAGLAALVSGTIGKEELEKRWKPNVTGLVEAILKGNRAVFDDLFWQHLAFQEKGINEIEKLYCENSLSKQEYLAWKKISEGNVWEGNKELLYHEQKDILQPILYSNHPLTWWTADTWLGIIVNWGNVLKSPIPGDSQTFESGITKSIGNFEDRWNWIESYILPKWQEFETNQVNKEALTNALKNVCPVLSNNNQNVQNNGATVLKAAQMQPNLALKTPPNNTTNGQMTTYNSSIPSLEITDMNGLKTNLNQIIESGKKYIIVLWAQYMGGCKKMLTDWKNFYPNWQKDIGLEIIPIHVHSETIQMESVRKGKELNNWPYTFYFCEDWKKTAKAFNSEALIPYVYVINDKNIIKEQDGFSGVIPIGDAINFDKYLRELFMNLNAKKTDTDFDNTKKTINDDDKAPSINNNFSLMNTQNGCGLEFSTKEIDYGTIKKGANGSKLVSYKNIGQKLIQITSIEPGCGPNCMTLNYSKNSLLPGQSSECEIKYNTDRLGVFYKYVTIFTDESQTCPPYVVIIKGTVID